MIKLALRTFAATLIIGTCRGGIQFDGASPGRGTGCCPLDKHRRLQRSRAGREKVHARIGTARRHQVLAA